MNKKLYESIFTEDVKDDIKFEKHAKAFLGLAKISKLISEFNKSNNTNISYQFKIGTYIPPNPGGYLGIYGLNDRIEADKLRKYISPILKSYYLTWNYSPGESRIYVDF